MFIFDGKTFADQPEELLKCPQDCVWAIHRTKKASTFSILKNGLVYQPKYEIVLSMADGYSDDLFWDSLQEDHRSYPEKFTHKVIFCLPKHIFNFLKNEYSFGVLPKEYAVGVLEHKPLPNSQELKHLNHLKKDYVIPVCPFSEQEMREAKDDYLEGNCISSKSRQELSNFQKLHLKRL